MVSIVDHQDMVNSMERCEPLLDAVSATAVSFFLSDSLKVLAISEAFFFSLANFAAIQAAKLISSKVVHFSRKGDDVSYGFKWFCSCMAIGLTYLNFKVANYAGSGYFSGASLEWGTMAFLVFKTVIVAGMSFYCDAQLSIPNKPEELEGVPLETTDRLRSYFLQHEKEWEGKSLDFQIQLLLRSQEGFQRLHLSSSNISKNSIESLEAKAFEFYFNYYSVLESTSKSQEIKLENYKRDQPSLDQEVLDAVCIRAAKDGILKEFNREWLLKRCFYQLASPEAQKIALELVNGD